MVAPHMRKELEELSRDFQRLIGRQVDDFLRWYILYSDENSELIKMIEAPEKEQQQFLAKCRKEVRALETGKPKLQKAPAKELMPKSKVPSAEDMFEKMFKGWPSDSGRPTVIPYGFYIQKLKEKLKKEAQKRERKR